MKKKLCILLIVIIAVSGLVDITGYLMPGI